MVGFNFDLLLDRKLCALTYYNLGLLQYALGYFDIVINNIETSYKLIVINNLSDKRKGKSRQKDRQNKDLTYNSTGFNNGASIDLLVSS